MKKWIAIFLALTAALTLTACSLHRGPAGVEDNDEVLVLYYSDSDILGKVAKDIGAKTGGHVVRIRRETPMPTDLKEAMEKARVESINHTLPPITTSVTNLKQYRTVYLCYPLWWGDMPMPVYTFLRENDMSGMEIIPVCAALQGDMAISVTSLRNEEPEAVVQDGYFLHTKETLLGFDDWLKSTGHVIHPDAGEKIPEPGEKE
jgi:flavodoxin